MVPSPTLQDVANTVAYEGRREFERDRNSTVRMIGLVFAPSHLPRTRRELWPAIDYWDRRSADNIDFFWPGYSAYRSDEADAVKLPHHWRGSRDDIPRYFNAIAFDRFRRDLRREIPWWMYSGNIELILINGKYNPIRSIAVLDFNSTLVLECEKLISSGADGDSIPGLFERIFGYAESANGDDPTWGFGQTLDSGDPSTPLWGMVRASLRGAITTADLAVGVHSVMSTLM